METGAARAGRSETVEVPTALISRLRERAQRAETQRCVPTETIAELSEAGLFRLLQPKAFGGLAASFADLVEVGGALGRACGSTAWVWSVLASHNWLVGMFPEEAQAEYWAESRDVLAALSLNPAKATCKRGDGGYIVSGQWDFASGVDHCSWCLVGAEVAGGSAGDLRLLLVPRADIRIRDTWHASGLCGTGSNDIEIDSAFVPEHRSVSMISAVNGSTAGGALHGSRLYGIPLFAIWPVSLVAPVLGMAEGALEDFVDHTAKRLAVYTKKPVKVDSLMHHEIGLASAESDAARTIILADCKSVEDSSEAGESLSLDQRVRYRRNHALAIRLSQQAVNRVARVAGAHAIRLESPLQRAVRDVQAATAHIALVPDRPFRLFGRTTFGLAPDEPMF